MSEDLIERKKAVDAVFELSDKLANEMLFIDAIVDEIENIPSAEPEIIRCENCKYNKNKPSAGNALCDKFYRMTDQMGFCYLAERRTDE